MRNTESTDDKQRIEIRVSRSKIVLITVGSLVFVLIGCSFIVDPEGWRSPIFRSSTVLFLVGILAVSFFGTCLLYGLYRIAKTDDIGLILDSDGFYDKSGVTSFGLVRWHDIRAIDTVQVESTRMLVIWISNDEEYINRASNLFTKGLAKLTKRWYGSPVVISTSGLKTDVDSLKKLLESHWRRFRRKKTRKTQAREHGK